MFNHILYFIIALLIFNVSYPEEIPASSLARTGSLLFLSWALFAAYCRLQFRQLLRRMGEEGRVSARSTHQYHRLIARLSVLALLLFALAVYLFSLKFWVQLVPGVRYLTVLQGTLALAVFVFYLCTIWHFAHPAHARLFAPPIGRRVFIRSNLRLHLPILFPWFALSLLYDLLSLSPIRGFDALLNRVEGQLFFFGGFLVLLAVFLPRLLQTWWGCRPLPDSPKARVLRSFLSEKGFRYRQILGWPLLEGRALTAGIMGIVGRYRYLLVTESLLEVLSGDELKAVAAHEMGHARYRHLLFYLFFFLGFMFLSYGLFDFYIYLFYAHPFVANLVGGLGSGSANALQLALSVPMLISLIIYFRFVMGFFMRHFERQADFYSAEALGTPQYTASALEKIALFSGRSRDLPSWHHFSIGERVDKLWQAHRRPSLVGRQRLMLALSFAAYLTALAGLGYLLNFSPWKERTAQSLVSRALEAQLAKEPQNARLHLNLAMLQHQRKDFAASIRSYEKALELEPGRAEALNNLAWLLVTAPPAELRDAARGLRLAERAVALERSAVFLDTLAEAYYTNGLRQEAVRSAQEALALAREDLGYYRSQLERFEEGGP